MEDADTRPAHGESGSQGVVGGIAFSGEQFSGLGIEESKSSRCSTQDLEVVQRYFAQF